MDHFYFEHASIFVTPIIHLYIFSFSHKWNDNSGNIVNITPRSPLIKMVPLVESSGGARGPILAHGLLPVSIINQDKNKL